MFWKTIVAIILTIAVASVSRSTGLTVVTFLVAMVIVLLAEGMRIVPQQNTWVVERLGKFHTVLEPGFNLIMPFVDRIAYPPSLKEVPPDIPEQVCITRDNTQPAAIGMIYIQAVDPRHSSYMTS